MSVVTMVFTHYVDRYVKSDRSVLLVNLCIVLILAYVTFLAGVNRVEYKVSGSNSFLPGNNTLTVSGRTPFCPRNKL